MIAANARGAKVSACLQVVSIEHGRQIGDKSLPWPFRDRDGVPLPQLVESLVVSA